MLMHNRSSIQTDLDAPLSIRGLSSSNVWDFENGFYWFSSPTRLNKMLAHYELYRRIRDLPGDIFELGVYKAASLIRLATFRNLLENDFSRKIVGFDAFGAFPKTNLTSSADHEFIERFENEGGDGLAVGEVKALCDRKGFRNIVLQEGNVFDTLPRYLIANPEVRIAFLHLDMDVKEPTGYALEILYDRVVPNGLIVFDDYNAVAGETDAVDQFLVKRKLSIQKIHYYAVPAFVTKPVS
jgi:Macrocin-O-methyltransferase (TylF)